MKRLSFRFCRRVLLILAILFPIVYLCGGLFSALWGAHGEQMFAEPVYTQEYVEVGNMGSEGSYKLSVNSFENVLIPSNFSQKSFSFSFVYLNNNERVVTFFFYDNKNIIGFRGESYSDIAMYNLNTNSYSNLGEGAPYIITFSYSSSALSFFDYLNSKNVDMTLFRLEYVPTDYVAENNSSYTDFIFSQPFAKDNFISQLGRGVLDGTAFGFPPFRDMFNWFNDSVMHIESDDALGVFGFGYAYYAMNVVAVYELVVLVLMVFTLPLKITDKFMGDKL